MAKGRGAAGCAGAWLLAALSACAPEGPGVDGASSAGLVFVRSDAGSRDDLARARLSDGAVAVLWRTPEREERWPYWSDVAQRVVFQVRPYGRDPRTDLYLWDPRRGEERALTPTPDRDERWPVWSPTEAALAFAFRGGGAPRAGIALLDLERGSTRFLATSRRRSTFLRPEFAPDGQRLVAQRRQRDGSSSTLWLLEPGRDPRGLTDDPGGFDTKARFSRDGRTIVFTRRRGTQNGPGDLARLDLASGEVEIFHSSPDHDDHSAKPSPTRDELVFVSDRDGSHDVFLAELAGGPARNLTRSPDSDEFAPVWSPDGERLVLTTGPLGSASGGSELDPTLLRLRVIDREGHVQLETAGRMADWMPPWP